jgi:ABC-2 type transport system permease protein
MHIHAIIAIARKDAHDVILNKTTIFMLLCPIFIAILFTIINGLMTTGSTQLLIYNPSNSPVQEIVSSYFQHAKVVTASSASEVAAAFGPNGVHKNSPYAMGLIVPPDFEAQIRQGQHPQLQLYVNGSQMNAHSSQVMSNLLTAYASSVATPHPLRLSIVTINPSSGASVLDIGTVDITMSLLFSLLVGISLVSNLLIEEREKKTLRMLMVSFASFTDMVLGKLLVALGYQLLISCLVIAIQRGFFGNVPVLVLFALLGAGFALSLGLLAGSLFQSNGALGGFTAIVSLVLVLSGFTVGSLASLLGSGGPFFQIMKILPTYYIAQGAYEALNNQSNLNNILFNASMVLAWAIILCLGAAWLLRCQAQVADTI